MTCDTMHKFEASGLGPAPYVFIGLESAADRGAIQSERAASGQIYTTNYATSCDYCGTGIQNAYWLQASDGRKFKVGCECIRKSGDAGLARVVDAEEKAKRHAKSVANRTAKMQREQRLLAKFRDGGAASLKTLPHPKGREGTAYDYCEWCLANHCYGAAVLAMIESA